MKPSLTLQTLMFAVGASLVLSGCGTTAPATQLSALKVAVSATTTSEPLTSTTKVSMAEAVGSRGTWIIGSRGTWIMSNQASTAAGHNNTFTENMAAWQQIHLPQAHARTPSMGSGIVVAVIDTGLDLGHPAFDGKLTSAGTWRDWVDGDLRPDDEGNYDDSSLVGFGHGTNVASLITQVAPGARILPLRVLAPNGTGNVADVVAAINYAVSVGVHVINLSVGSDNSSDVDKAVMNATASGVYVVASSGNTGDKKVTAPARYATDSTTEGTMSLSVGSVNRSDLKSTFSTYGSKLELLAPGEQMLGAAPAGSVEAWSGTSMAAPVASGILALALGELPPGQRNKWVGRIAEQLAVTADLVDTANDATLAGQLGRGRLNAEKFIASILGK